MSILDTQRFAAYIKTKRGHRSLRAIAHKIPDISASTLSRIEHGMQPDITTFLRICDWLEVRAEEFILDQAREEPLPTLQCIEVLLRSDPALSEQSAETMIAMLSSLYGALTHDPLSTRSIDTDGNN